MKKKKGKQKKKRKAKRKTKKKGKRKTKQQKRKNKKEKRKRKIKKNTFFTLCLLEVTSKGKKKTEPKSSPIGLDKREAHHTPTNCKIICWQQCQLSWSPRKNYQVAYKHKLTFK